MSSLNALSARVAVLLIASSVLVLAVPACVTDTPAGVDGGAPTTDATYPADSGAGGDAGGSREQGVSADAGQYVGTPCSVGGTAGTCQLVSECAMVSTAGYCPGPADVRCCHPPIPTTDQGTPRDAGGACDPAVIPTPNAGLTEAAGQGGCPAGMTAVSDFCVDVYEAFVRIDRGGGVVEDWSPYHHPPALGADETLVAYSVAGAIPQSNISGVQARQACEGAGKRLCTDVEWLRACQGANEYVYPYGDTRDPGVCNEARSLHPAVEYFGTSASWIWSRLGDPCINQQDDTLDRAGENAGCVSEDGAWDMMGNVHEWTAAASGTFRGGFYADTVVNGNGCLYRTTAHDVQHWDYSTGFRCCADPL